MEVVTKSRRRPPPEQINSVPDSEPICNRQLIRFYLIPLKGDLHAFTLID